jgi:hypothetical protein
MDNLPTLNLPTAISNGYSLPEASLACQEPPPVGLGRSKPLLSF